MPHATITTELVRQLRHQRPSAVTDYRDPKLPGFVLRARPTGIHSWRVQLPNRRWLTIGRTDEVALSDARDTAQTRRAQAALGQDIPTRRPTSDVNQTDKHASRPVTHWDVLRESRLYRVALGPLAVSAFDHVARGVRREMR